MPDTSPAPLDSALINKRALVRYSPEINTGNVIQILVILAGFISVGWGFSAAQEKFRLEIAQLQKDVEVNKANLAREVDSNRQEVRTSLENINRSIDGINSKLNDVNTNVAVLKAQNVPHK